MEKDLLYYEIEEDEDNEVLTLPYYYVMYLDDEGRKHIATITNINYFNYIKDRFTLLEYKYITE